MPPHVEDIFPIGSKVKIGDRLLGGELFNLDDPSELVSYLGRDGVVLEYNKDTNIPGCIITHVKFDDGYVGYFMIQEIEGIADEIDAEIPKSEMDLEYLFN